MGGYLFCRYVSAPGKLTAAAIRKLWAQVTARETPGILRAWEANLAEAALNPSDWPAAGRKARPASSSAPRYQTAAVPAKAIKQLRALPGLVVCGTKSTYWRPAFSDKGEAVRWTCVYDRAWPAARRLRAMQNLGADWLAYNGAPLVSGSRVQIAPAEASRAAAERALERHEKWQPLLAIPVPGGVLFGGIVPE